MLKTDRSLHHLSLTLSPNLQSAECAIKPGPASPTTTTTATRTAGTRTAAEVAAAADRALRTCTTRDPSGRSPSPRPPPRTAGKALKAKVRWSCYPKYFPASCCAVVRDLGCG